MKNLEQVEKKAPNTDGRTLDLMFNEIKERLKSQFDAIRELENKANRIIGLVGLITGLGMAWIQSPVRDELFKSLGSQQVIIIYFIYCLGIVLFLLSICLAFLAYKVASYRADPNPKKLAEKYFYSSHKDLTEQLIDNFATSYTENTKIMHRKAQYVN